MGKLRNFSTLAQETFMSMVIQEPGPQSPLQGLDPNLSFIASQAAIELDNLLLGTSKKLDAVHDLALRLKNSAEEISGSTTMRNLMDPQSIRVFSQAYTETQGESVSTIDELANKAWRIAGDLDEAKADPQRQTLERLRSFCVALSRIASAQRMAMMDRKPGLPFKR